MRYYPRKLLGALFVVFAVGAGAIGVLWVYLASVGTEWDYCRRGGCTDGEVMAIVVFIVPAVLAGVAGFLLLRGGKHG